MEGHNTEYEYINTVWSFQCHEGSSIAWRISSVFKTTKMKIVAALRVKWMIVSVSYFCVEGKILSFPQEKILKVVIWYELLFSSPLTKSIWEL